MDLTSLKPAEGSTKNRKRIGRGQGSGRGGTSTRGHKGAKSRSGYSKKIGFEGGQMPIQRRLPKFGFTNINRKDYKAVNIEEIETLAQKSKISIVDITILKNAGIIAKNDMVKILGKGILTVKLEIKAHAFSKSAIESIEKAGGTAIKI